MDNIYYRSRQGTRVTSSLEEAFHHAFVDNTIKTIWFDINIDEYCRLSFLLVKRTDDSRWTNCPMDTTVLKNMIHTSVEWQREIDKVKEKYSYRRHCTYRKIFV